MRGLVTIGSISFGIAFVAGKNRVPYPAAGNRHFLMTDIAQGFRKRVFRELKKAISLIAASESTSSFGYIDPFSDPVIAVFETDDIVLSKIFTNLNFNDFYRFSTGIGQSMFTSDRNIR